MHFSIWLMTFLRFAGVKISGSGNETTTDSADLSLEKGIYDGCGKAKFCVGLPYHCIENKSCKEFVATFKKGKYLKLSILITFYLKNTKIQEIMKIFHKNLK